MTRHEAPRLALTPDEASAAMQADDLDVLVRTPEPLPELIDCTGIMKELCVKRASAEAIMRQLPVVQIPDLRKVYVRRSDVVAYLEAHTFTNEQVPR